MKKKTKVEAVRVDQVETVRKAELQKFRQSMPAVIQQADRLVVKDAADETVAYSHVVQMKAMLKAAEQRRKAITQPLETAKKETIRLFRDLVGPLEEAVGRVSGKITTFRDEQEAIAAEAERQRAAEAERVEAEQRAAQARADSLKTKKAKDKAQAVADELEDELDELDSVEYVADVGAASVTKTWTYEIEDEASVPRKYCSPDRGKLRAAVRDGVREIKGVEVFQTSSVRAR